MKEEKVRVTVKLSEEEKAKLERDSSRCGLSQTAFLRMLIAGKTPEPAPPKVFWEMLSALYSLHDSFAGCIPYYPKAEEICKEIQHLILNLQYEFTIPKEDNLWQQQVCGISEAV